WREPDPGAWIRALGSQPPRPALLLKLPSPADALAFHPDGQRLAVAGGDNHEVSLWDFDKRKQISEIRSPGSSLWGVGLSENGRLLGFRIQRDSNPNSPNTRGKGDWRVFDLDKRRWAQAQDFQPVRPLDRANGWTVQFSQ